MTIRNLFLPFVLAFALQTAHYAEHVAQLIQIYTLGIPPPAAHGLLGSWFDFEWVHFLFNLGLEIVLVVLWLSYRSIWPATASTSVRRGVGLLTALVVFQGYHSLEHMAKLYQYLFVPLYQSGLPPTPGILPSLTGWPIFLVHFWLNTIVWVAMFVALWHLRPHPLTRTSVSAQSAVSHR